jgi:hypothetical protein
MEYRRTLVKIVGLVQTAVGGLSIAFAFLSFYNIFNVRTMLGATEMDIGFYLWVFIIIGLLSIINGLFLLYEQTKEDNHD